MLKLTKAKSTWEADQYNDDDNDDDDTDDDNDDNNNDDDDDCSPLEVMMMSWCLMSSDVIWHIRDKLWPMPKHGSVKATYVRCMRV